MLYVQKSYDWDFTHLYELVTHLAKLNKVTNFHEIVLVMHIYVYK